MEEDDESLAQNRSHGRRHGRVPDGECKRHLDQADPDLLGDPTMRLVFRIDCRANALPECHHSDGKGVAGRRVQVVF